MRGESDRTKVERLMHAWAHAYAADVAEMLRRGLVDAENLWRYFEAIEPELVRYPAIEPAVFWESVLAVVRKAGSVPEK